MNIAIRTIIYQMQKGPHSGALGTIKSLTAKLIIYFVEQPIRTYKLKFTFPLARFGLQKLKTKSFLSIVSRDVDGLQFIFLYEAQLINPKNAFIIISYVYIDQRSGSYLKFYTALQ